MAHGERPSPGYAPKYRGTGLVGHVSGPCLAPTAATSACGRRCAYVLDHSRRARPMAASPLTASPSGVDPLSARATWRRRCIDLGWLGDPRLDEAIDWLARSITGDGHRPGRERRMPRRATIAPATAAPAFVCSANNHRPCAWGAVKAMLALGKIPAASAHRLCRRRSPPAREFLLSRDPAVADYPDRVV